MSLLAVLILACAPAGAQTRVTAVEAAAVSVVPVLPSIPAPLAPTLTPSLPGAPSLSAAPSPALPAVRLARPAAANAALPASAFAEPIVAAAAAAPAAQAQAAPVPEALKPVQAALAEAAPDGLDALDDDGLLSLTKRLAGESYGGAGAAIGAYLRPSQPFAFGDAQAASFAHARLDAAFSMTPEKAHALVETARALAESAGIAVAVSALPASEGKTHEALVVTPAKEGTALNRMAWELKNGHGVTMAYVPERTRGAVAAFNGAEKLLLLPAFDQEESFEAILHESRHAHFLTRLTRGDLSIFHPAVVAYQGFDIARGASSYTNYLSFEELSTFPKTLRHLSGALQRGAGPKKLALLRSHADHYADILRSARYNLRLLRARLDKGEVQASILEGPGWPSFPGGRWYRVNLGHAAFAIPVMDDAAPPVEAPWWKKPFAKKPESAQTRAIRKTVDALEAMTQGASGAYGEFRAEAAKESPDYGKLVTLTGRLIALARDADDLR